MFRTILIGLATVGVLGLPQQAWGQGADAAAEALSGCWSLSAEETGWDLGDWDGDPVTLPAVPRSIELRMTKIAQPEMPISSRAHSIPPVQPTQRRAAARDSSGTRLSGLDSWIVRRTGNFQVGRLSLDGAVLIYSWLAEGERNAVAVYSPSRFNGTPPTIRLGIRREACP